MAKFLTGSKLNTELEKIFEKAEEQIILISPFIKLHDRFISTLLTKKDNHRLKIIIVFGKNEEDISKSMKQEDFNFFKEFPNIEIRYERRLHAKYYANEFSSILTSMNLYNYSQDNNIEAGVIAKSTSKNDLDGKAGSYFKRVIKQSDLLFQKIPQYESTMLGLTKKYKESKVEVDKLTEFFADKLKFESKYKKDYSKVKKVESSQAIPQQIISQQITFNGKYLSTTALSKEIGISSKDLTYKFEKLNWIEKINDGWVLTSLGKSKGAEMKQGKYGEYIAYPETLINELR